MGISVIIFISFQEEREIPEFSIEGCLEGKKRNGSRETDGLEGKFAEMAIGVECDVDMALSDTSNG